jgi:hypothetical protein
MFRRSVPVLRTANRAMPRRQRDFPVYVEAMRRIAGQLAHDPFGRFLERLALRAIEPSPAVPPRDCRSESW